MIELIENGTLAQTLLVIVIWGAIAFLAVSGRPIPDAMLDAGFVIVGFYFHATAARALTATRAARARDAWKRQNPTPTNQ